MRFAATATLAFMVLSGSLASATAAETPLPDAIAAPGETATANDMAWLKLEAIAHRGSGILAAVTTVQRINTMGGQLAGACDKPGATRSSPYSADYVFLRKG